jgi:hypothetical protein
MKNSFWTLVAVLAGAFPFLALGYKLFENSSTAGIVYSAIVLVLFVSAFIAARINITLPEAVEAAAGRQAIGRSAQPIRWSWDGLDRQPEDEEAGD